MTASAETLPSSSGTMSRRARSLRQAREQMVAVREEIVRAVAGRSDEDLLRTPAGGGWCAAEILDHIGIAERKVVKGLLKTEKGEAVRLPRGVWFYRVPVSPFFWRFKLRAPKLVRPRSRAEIAPSEVLAGLAASRRELLGLADRLGPERFSRLVLPHVFLGRFTGLAWFRFIARHESRHLAQIKRVLGAGRGEPS